jgi:cytoskeletal protein RodZ
MNKLQNIGKILKETRENRSLNLSDIADILKIRRKYLESIELGDYSDIPGKAYINGYIKMYAEYLGIPSEIKKIQNEGKPQRVKFSKAKKHIGDNWIVASIFSILILILIFLVWSRLSKDESKTPIQIMLEKESNSQ